MSPEKKMKKFRNRYGIWIGLFLFLDLIFCLCLWLMEAQAFAALTGIIFLGTAVLFLAAVLIAQRAERKRIAAFERFVEQPHLVNEEMLMLLAYPEEKEQIQRLGARMREMEQEMRSEMVRHGEQEEYVEVWAHEIKNALSLMTFLLDNRKEEMSDAVYDRMEYVRNQIQAYVNQMLYYERLEAVHKDYVLEELDLRACVEAVLEEYRRQLEELDVRVENHIEEETVTADRKGLEFMLGQAVSNAVKYAGNAGKGEVIFETEKEPDGEGLILRIRDNGRGAQVWDLPFVFDKGFVGDSGEGRKKATGMGLYLLKRMADDLKIQVEAKSQYGEGFELRMKFPETAKDMPNRG